ncbi:hypothetical protein FY034_11320 [Trichlorobacter lovleyi]|uniref:hypothetical protein n=1 Tax=Trichlorobacter lovleyi TaxID=313985 RepID=UPI00223F83DC|nr:hypothetical protein [Trichlorobacter lovleyi]QOX79502.1 hypothetical protein FY034_11320 [Trichlorobacter lovleyi]
MINGLESKWINDSPDNEDKIRKLFDKDMRDFQGYAAATLIVEADPSRAEEIALEETQKSLLILRLFSAAAFHPKITTKYNIWGSEQIDRAKILFLKEDKLSLFNDRLLDSPHTIENMDQECIKMHMAAGLNIVSDLLTRESANPFQKMRSMHFSFLPVVLLQKIQRINSYTY